MAQLAIKGHATRGKEVIEILEMLGGINELQHRGNADKLYIIQDGEIHLTFSTFDYCFKVFTLEEFLEKFPYKIGDRVKIPNCDVACRVTNMIWNGIEIEYETTNSEETFFADELQPYKEETMEIPEKLMPKIDFNEYCKDKYILDLGNYEIKEENGKTYAVRKRLEYPKTYEECCEIIGIEYPVVGGKPDGLSASTYRIDEIRPFIYLFICRDAYWKIAGEQMGLGKPWEPDWFNAVYTCTIICRSNKIVKDAGFDSDNRILAFPIIEMRDAFYENFKELIMKCKELL